MTDGCFEVAANWELDNLKILAMEAPLEDSPSFTKIAQSVEESKEIKLHRPVPVQDH